MLKIRVPISALIVVVCALVGVLAIFSAPVLAAGCPNERVRTESNIDPATGLPFSLQLPECRAYEMVSPPLKNGDPIGNEIASAGRSEASVARVGSEGSSALIRSQGIWPGGEQPPSSNLLNTKALEGVQYRLTRGESGWQFKPEMPPVGSLRDFKSSLLASPVDLGGDRSGNGIWEGVGVAPAEAEMSTSAQGFSKDPNFYLLEPGGTLAEIGPSVPLEDRNFEEGFEGGKVATGPGVITAVGGSADLSRVLFSLPILRWPFDETKLNIGNNEAEEISSLYEYVGTGHSGELGDAPTLVGVDNRGTLISQCGTEAGGYEGVGGNRRSDESGETEARSISADGSTVFFTSRAPEPKCKGGTGPAVNEVFARVGEPGQETTVGNAVTVNVAGSAEAGGAACTSNSCNVTKPVKYQGASASGSEVFFTSEQPLVAGDTDSTNNLYECRLPGDSGAALTPVSPVNPCPDLVRVSVPVPGASAEAAEVQSVVAVSQEGSHVYFVAKGELAGPNAEGERPTPGQDNLYVWAEGRTAFIAMLSSPAFKLGEAQTTPDGDSLVFTSSADLVPGDTSTVAQVFLYEASHEVLTWVSRGQGGVEDGNTTAEPASLTAVATGEEEIDSAEGRRVISEDGSVVVFQSSAALTSQVHGGKSNVYLWRGGDLYLISDGTPADSHASTQVGLVGVDASGQNVFFTTEVPLVGQDSDELSDLYDARIDGGFPAPKVEGCAGEACQGVLSAPPAPVTLGSLSAGVQGNLTPSPPKYTSFPPKPGPLTRAQELAKALKVCAKDKTKGRRASCDAAARRRYGAKAKRKTGNSVGRRAK